MPANGYVIRRSRCIPSGRLIQYIHWSDFHVIPPYRFQDIPVKCRSFLQANSRAILSNVVGPDPLKALNLQDSIDSTQTISYQASPIEWNQLLLLEAAVACLGAPALPPSFGIS